MVEVVPDLVGMQVRYDNVMHDEPLASVQGSS